MIQLRNQGFGVGSTHSMLGSVLLLVSWLMPVIWLNCRETSSRWVPRFAGSVKLPFIEFSRRYLPDEATTQKSSHWSISLLRDASGLMVVSYSWCRAGVLPHYCPSICILTTVCLLIYLTSWDVMSELTYSNLHFMYRQSGKVWFTVGH